MNKKGQLGTIVISLTLIGLLLWIFFTGGRIDHNCWNEKADELCDGTSRNMTFIEDYGIWGRINIECNGKTFKYKSNEYCFDKFIGGKNESKRKDN